MTEQFGVELLGGYVLTWCRENKKRSQFPGAVGNQTAGDVGKTARGLQVIQTRKLGGFALHREQGIELGKAHGILIINGLVGCIKHKDLGIIPAGIANESTGNDAVANAPVFIWIGKTPEIMKQETVVQVTDGDVDRSVVGGVCTRMLFFRDTLAQFHFILPVCPEDDGG